MTCDLRGWWGVSLGSVQGQGQQATPILWVTTWLLGCQAGSCHRPGPAGGQSAVGLLISSICAEGEGTGWGSTAGKGGCHVIPGAPYGPVVSLSQPEPGYCLTQQGAHPPTSCLTRAPRGARQGCPMTDSDNPYKYTAPQGPRCVHLLALIFLSTECDDPRERLAELSQTAQ